MQQYDTNLSKGTGLIDETLALLAIYEQDISREDFYEKVIQYNLLSKSTENRTQDIVKRVFFKRYWRDDQIDVALALKRLREEQTSLPVLKQILLIYTCRINPILQDFIEEVYFKLADKGYEKLTSEDYQGFIKTAIKDGKIDPPWSDTTVIKVGRYLHASLADFGLADQQKNILPFQIYDGAANYLAHELHFRGLGDDQILHHPDWRIFGTGPADLVAVLNRISWQGHFIVQYSGELLKISWKYESMENFIDGLTNP